MIIFQNTDRAPFGLNGNNLNFDRTGSRVSALDCQTVDALSLRVVCLLTSNPVSSLLTSSWTQTDGGGNQ